MNRYFRTSSRGIWARAAFLGLAGFAPLLTHAAAGNPLPRCDAGSRSFYLSAYSNPTALTVPPTTQLLKVVVNADNTVTSTPIWTAQGDVAPAPEPAGVFAGASVAMGMNPNNGYIYALRATDGEVEGTTFPNYTGHYQVLKYGASGVTNLGPIQSAPTINTPDGLSIQINYNAADFNPATGELIVALFRDGTAGNKNLSSLIRVSVAGDVPKYEGRIALSRNIPGAQAGDFAIDKNGVYAYGVSIERTGVSTRFRINLLSGVVEDLGATIPLGPPNGSPYGGAATLQDGTVALYAASGAIRIMSTPDGAISGSFAGVPSDSSDATSCLPAQPIVTLACTPTTLVDAAGNQSVCTLTSDTPAGASGLTGRLQLPLANPRYSSSCPASLTIAAGATTAQCTITATPNTVVGDGAATAALALQPDNAYTVGVPASAAVVVNDDDVFVPPSITLACTPTSLVDSVGSESVCTVTSDTTAPTGGLAVMVQVPAVNPRYNSTCASPLVIAAGQASAQCTITATPNTVVGDGSVSAVITLQADSAYTIGAANSATVAVNDDDIAPPEPGAPTPIPLGAWPAGLGILAAAWVLLRRGRASS